MDKYIKFLELTDHELIDALKKYARDNEGYAAGLCYVASIRIATLSVIFNTIDKDNELHG